MINVVIRCVLIQLIGEGEDGVVIVIICNCYGVTKTQITTLLLCILVIIPR
jgi:hypothetical protein